MQESILSLLKNRGKKEVEKSADEEIEAIEKEKKKYLEKVNEERENKIENVEVYKVDIDLESNNIDENEGKTQGELFAENLRKQFLGTGKKDDEESRSDEVLVEEGGVTHLCK